MKEMQVRATGIAWYKPDEYNRFRKLCSDGRKLPPTYNQWLKQANKAIDRFTAEGNIVEKVYLDLDTFPDWCKRRGLDIDAKARIRFANEFVFAKYGNTH